MKKFFALSLFDVVFIMLINVKCQQIVGILTFMSRINFSDVVIIMLINVKCKLVVGILTFMSRINFVLS